jgi:hypothetical protein
MLKHLKSSILRSIFAKYENISIKGTKIGNTQLFGSMIFTGFIKLGPVVQRWVSAIPGLKFNPLF